MYHCAECSKHGCEKHDMEQTMTCCPCKEEEIQTQAKALYAEEENHRLALSAALVEAEGYGVLCRMEEIMLFAKKAGFQKIGLVFCVGFKEEARTVSRILRHNGFEVVSVACKNGDIPKSSLGVKDEQTLSGCGRETMCNPIGQALLMNKEKVELNVLLGLCVGHDSLALKYLEAPATILGVKDRVTGHNPMAAIYLADGYYKKRFFK